MCIEVVVAKLFETNVETALRNTFVQHFDSFDRTGIIVRQTQHEGPPGLHHPSPILAVVLD